MLKYILPAIYAVRPKTVFQMIQKRMGMVIPLNQLLGIEVVSIGSGTAEARATFRPEVTNHIHTAHATLIFGVAEAASGAAMSGAIAPQMAAVKPVAAGAEVKFMKPCRSDVFAKARVGLDPLKVQTILKEEGKVSFDVNVEVFDDANVQVAEMRFNWHVSRRG